MTEHEPLTDEELHTTALEVEGWSLCGMHDVTPEHASWVGVRLVAEVRRLREIEKVVQDVYTLGAAGVSGDETEMGIGFAIRSDEWVQRAAEEISGVTMDRELPPELVIEIIKKHRDGKA